LKLHELSLLPLTENCPLSTAADTPITDRLVQTCQQHLWLVKINEAYQQFTYVGHALQPSAAAAWCWQQLESPHGFFLRASLSLWLQTTPLPASPAPLGYR
jgi:hypothetical protein